MRDLDLDLQSQPRLNKKCQSKTIMSISILSIVLFAISITVCEIFMFELPNGSRNDFLPLKKVSQCLDLQVKKYVVV